MRVYETTWLIKSLSIGSMSILRKSMLSMSRAVVFLNISFFFEKQSAHQRGKAQELIPRSAPMRWLQA